MRINVYQEEITEHVEVVSTTAETDRTFYGVRMWLKSHPDLHHTPEDDDRSAVTLWVRDREIAAVLSVALADAFNNLI